MARMVLIFFVFFKRRRRKKIVTSCAVFENYHLWVSHSKFDSADLGDYISFYQLIGRATKSAAIIAWISGLTFADLVGQF